MIDKDAEIRENVCCGEPDKGGGLVQERERGGRVEGEIEREGGVDIVVLLRCN